MQCERKMEMTDEERLREMVTHTIANVVESLGQVRAATRHDVLCGADREAVVDGLREAEGHCWMARVMEMGAGQPEDELKAENAALREEVEALKANRCGPAFLDDELGDVLRGLLYLDRNHPNAKQVEDELARREGSHE